MDYVGPLKELHRRELPGGGWSFSDSSQMNLETTCLATFSVLAERPSSAPHVVRLLLRAQLPDGSWPSFIGDGKSSWTTALAICVLNSANDSSGARERGQSWLLKTKGREGHRFWRWRFKLADRADRFDPDCYGWPWIRVAVLTSDVPPNVCEQLAACMRAMSRPRDACAIPSGDDLP